MLFQLKLKESQIAMPLQDIGKLNLIKIGCNINSTNNL